MILKEGKLGSEGSWKAQFAGGKLSAELAADTKLVDANIVVKIDSDIIIDALVDKLEALIPGDQKVWAEMAKAALKK